jgi:hypothetical protein
VGRPSEELLIEAMEAVLKNELAAVFEERTRNLLDRARKTWRALLGEWIVAVNRDPTFFVHTFRSMLLDPSEYRRWRDEKGGGIIQATRRLSPASQKDLAKVVKDYVAAERAMGNSCNQKRAWEWVKAKLPGASHSRVIGALRSAEGEKNREAGRAARVPRQTKNPWNRGVWIFGFLRTLALCE